MKKNFLSLLILGVLWPITFLAQIPFPELPPVFKDDVVPRVDILLPDDSLAVLLAPGNQGSDYHWHATFVFDNSERKDTVENVGFRLRGNTSRNSEKKSFKISFNTYEPGRKWHGLEKLNLNGEHNDPAVIRSKICWDLLRWMEVPAPRANHVDLYINGGYFGLYINVEHVDEEFVQNRFGNNDGNLYKCLWPADLAYKGPNPNLYKGQAGSRRTYELLTNTAQDDYSDLAEFIDVLNNTPANNLPCQLEQVFNVDNYLKIMAFDILTANWDGAIYNKNNFYLYKNLATGQFEYIPYDLDNTFGIDWFNVNWATRNIYAWKPSNEARPIYEKILAVQEYRDRFSFYMHRILTDFYKQEVMFPYMDSIRSMIAPSAQADPYRPLDYGFTYADFLASYDSALPVVHTKAGLKPFISTRRDAAIQQLILNNTGPILTEVSNNSPNAAQDILIKTMAEDDVNVASVQVCYQLNGQNLNCITMFDDGLHADGGPGDAVYGVVIDASGAPGMLEYFIKATDNTGKESRSPVCGFKQILIGAAAEPLVINEVMASNSNTIADEAGEYDDWVEILNTGDVQLYLGNRFLSDNPGSPGKWRFPDMWIQPAQHLVIWADGDQTQGPLHTSFKLNAGGEFIGIYTETGVLIDGYHFGPQMTDVAIGRIPNGTGPFQPVFPTPGQPNEALTPAMDLHEQEVDVSIFPNPFSDLVIVRGGQDMDGWLTDVYGRPLSDKRELDKDTGIVFSTEGLAAGVYLFVVKTASGKQIVKRLVLQRP